MNKVLDTFPKNKKLILFDGVCNLCNNAVKKVIQYDRKNVFLFAALQSEIGEKIIEELGIDTSKIDSIILYIPNEAFYIKSTAAIRIMKEFSGIWKLSQITLLLPTLFNDFIYDFVAKNRTKWFGKREQCMIPTEKLKERFL